MVARIIILNGAGSVGKSSIARALQEITAEPFLRVAMDAFLDMLPVSYMDHPDGLMFEDQGEPAIAIRTGHVAARAFRGMRRRDKKRILRSAARRVAGWQYDRVHAGRIYDLAIDASISSPEVCALKIKEALSLRALS